LALTRTGTEFVVKGFSQFINSLKAINREYKNIADNSAKMASKVADAGEKLKRAQDRSVNAVKNLEIAQKNLDQRYKEFFATHQDYHSLLQEGIDISDKLARKEIALMRAILAHNKAVQERVNSETDAHKAAGLLNSAIEEMATAAAQGTSGINVLKAGLGALTGTIGVVITVLGAYIAVVVAAIGITLKLAKAIINAAKFIGSVLVKAVKLAIDVINTLLTTFAKLGKSILSIVLAPFKVLGTFLSRTFAVTMGVLVRDSIRAVIDALGRLKDAVIGTISSFQTLEIRLQNLIARELRMTGAIENVADAFEAATEPANRLSQWIRTMSTQIPFDVNVIGNTTAFAMAMGFTEEQAKSLTLSISNFAAGMGLTSDKMESIIFNFGQMKAAGKVTGTEMRDLARGAFLPLTDVLDEAAKLMGINVENMVEFRKQAAAGEVPIDIFFKAFQNVVERDFPDAVERMGKTLQGIATRFKNFLKTVVGVEILGPIFKRIGEAASNALDKLMTPAVLRTARAIGKALDIAYQLLAIWVQPLIEELKKLAQAFGLSAGSAETWVTVVAYITAILKRVILSITDFVKNLRKNTDQNLGEMVKSWAQYGANMVISLARGMAAAFSAVVKVLIALGKLIASFLKAKSPPKLLPHLDKWGAEAMTAYMKGWLNADFGVFNDLADKVESYVRSLTDNILPEKNVIPTILGLRENIAKAVSGKISFGNIFAGFGNATKELKNYVRSLVDVGKATKELEKAQKELNDVTDKYDKILDPLYKQLDRLTDATQDFDDSRRKSLLELIKTDVNASEGDKRRAQLEINRLNLEKKIRGVENEREDAIKVAEDAVDIAEKNLAALEAELEAKEALVDIQIKTNELIKEQLALLESLKSAGGGGLPIDPDDLGLDIPIPEIPGTDELGLDDIDFGKIFVDAQEAIDKFFDETLPGMLESVEKEFEPLTTQMEELETVWGGVWTSLTTKWEDFTKSVEENGGGLEGVLTTIRTKLEEVFGPFLLTIEPGVAALAFSTGQLADSIRDLGAAFGIGGENAGIFNSETQTMFGNVFNLIAAFISLGLTVVSIWVDTFGGVLEDIRSWWEETKRVFTVEGATLGNIWRWIWRTAWLIASGWKGAILRIVLAFKDAVVELFEDLATALVGESIIPDMIDDILAAFEQAAIDWLEPFTDFIDNVVEAVTTFATETIPGWFETLGKTVSDIIGGEGGWGSTWYTNAYNALDSLWSGFKAIWPSIVTWIEEKFAWVSEKWAAINKQDSPSKVMIKKGQDFMKGLAIGLEKGYTYPEMAMQKAGSNLISAAPVYSGDTISTVNNTNYTLNMPTTASPASVERAFGVMRLMST